MSSPTYAIQDVVQKTDSGVADLANDAFAVDPQSGDVIFVAVADYTGTTGNPHLAPTDTEGNTYTQIGTEIEIDTHERISLWSTVVVTGGSSFVVTSHITTAAYQTQISWLVRPDTAVFYQGDAAQSTTADFDATAAAGPTSPAPAAASFFLCIGATRFNDDALSPPSGWNSTGVNGFTSGLAAKAIYGGQTATVALYTEYKVASTAQLAEWVRSFGLNTVAVLAGSVGIGAASSALPIIVHHYREQGIQ